MSIEFFLISLILAVLAIGIPAGIIERRMENRKPQMA